MKGKKILIAFAVLILLSAYFYFFGIKKKQDEQKAKENEAVIFPGLHEEDITELTVKIPDSKIALKNTGGAWDMTEPLQVPADKSLAIAIVRHLRDLKADRKIEGAALADYGLNTPQAYISFTAKDKKTGTFYMAGYNPSGELAYGYKAGDNAVVYLVGRDMRLDCEKKVSDFRYKGILRIKSEAVAKIEVNLKDKKYTLEKQGEDWYVTQPVYRLAKKDRAIPIAEYFINSNVKAYFPASDEGKYGLSNPSEYIKVYEGKTEHTVYYGNMDKKNSSVFVKSGLQPWVLEVPDNIYKTGASNLNEVYNKQVAVFKMEDAAELEVKYGEKYIKAKRNKKGKMPDWIVEEMKVADKTKTGMFNAGTLIGSIYWAEFKKEIKNPGQLMEASTYGVSPAFVDITVKNKDKKIMLHLLVGAKADAEDVYVKNVLTNTVYLIPESAVKNMNIPELELK